MRKLLFLLVLSLPSIAAAEQRIVMEYGRSATVEFELYAADGTLSTSEADGGAEVTVVCDGDGGTTATNDFVDEGFAYSLVLTVAELECAHVTLNVAATLDHAIIIETCGTPNAQHMNCAGGLYITGGTAQAGSTTSTTVLAAAEGFADDDLNDFLICQVEDQVSGDPRQCRVISDYTGASDTATHTAFIAALPTGGEYIIYPDPSTILTVSNGIVDANTITIESVDATNALDTAHTDYDAATGTEMATAQADLDIITGSDGTILSAAAVDLIWDEVIETAGTTYTGRCLLAALGAYVAGEFTTTGNTTTYQDTGGNSTRIVGTVIANGRDTMSITCP